MNEFQRPETLMMSWLDPRDGGLLPAGVAFYIETLAEYALKIDEEPSEKDYFLQIIGKDQNTISYRLNLKVKNRSGNTIKKQTAGYGFSDLMNTRGNIHINFGSKYKTLVIHQNTKESKAA